MSSEQFALSDPQTIQTACDLRLRTMFPASELVWIIDEQYSWIGPTWIVTVICQVAMGRWAQRRYCYDIPSDTLDFSGERPASERDLLAARRDGRRLWL